MSAEIVKINALVNADINKAWNCYTQPEHIVKWNFASDDWQCPWARMIFALVVHTKQEWKPKMVVLVLNLKLFTMPFLKRNLFPM